MSSPKQRPHKVPICQTLLWYFRNNSRQSGNIVDNVRRRGMYTCLNIHGEEVHGGVWLRRDLHPQ